MATMCAPIFIDFIYILTEDIKEISNANLVKSSTPTTTDIVPIFAIGNSVRYISAGVAPLPLRHTHQMSFVMTSGPFYYGNT